MTLNNLAQSQHWHINYLASSSGPLHTPKWKAVAYINQIAIASGTGRSKAAAMEKAALLAYEHINPSAASRQRR